MLGVAPAIRISSSSRSSSGSQARRGRNGHTKNSILNPEHIRYHTPGIEEARKNEQRISLPQIDEWLHCLEENAVTKLTRS